MIFLSLGIDNNSLVLIQLYAWLERDPVPLLKYVANSQ